ncbi:MAG: YihA family ribosome biogenesis GTP-binding protein [Alphaproteobacteria bacterium 41-28]|nr:MAG: YihA family ribosome biogenesis GTP-binding protein [Alphaproteobacteria bacterium 41-28]
MSSEKLSNISDYPRWLFAQECTFVAGADRIEILPPPTLPEIAFAGRSNVGKSSLINALLGRNSLARVSHTPGRTQQLNFFLLGKRFYIVDMPGYGYAAASKAKIKIWSRLIQDYLKGRVPLKRVFLLIDSRHGFKGSDEAVMEELDKAAVSYQIVLTKSDKSTPTHLDELITSLTAKLKKHPAAFPTPLLTSSHEKEGLEPLRKVIAELVG